MISSNAFPFIILFFKIKIEIEIEIENKMYDPSNFFYNVTKNN